MEFKIDERCIGCGRCAAECPTALLYMDDGRPKVGKSSCIACGHCVAVCPTEAIDYDVTPRSAQLPLTNYTRLTAEEAELFLRSRRSVRTYLPRQVEKETLLKLLDVARQAPTGSNTQGVSFKVIQNPATLKAIKEQVIAGLEEAGKTDARLRIYARNARHALEQGQDFILRGAPTLVLALGKADLFPRARDNGHFCLTYAELMAPSLGLGTCWAGFVEFCTQAGDPKWQTLLNLPEGLQVAGAMMVGYPAYTYRYAPNRAPLEVSFDSK